MKNVQQSIQLLNNESIQLLNKETLPKTQGLTICTARSNS